MPYGYHIIVHETRIYEFTEVFDRPLTDEEIRDVKEQIAREFYKDYDWIGVERPGVVTRVEVEEIGEEV